MISRDELSEQLGVLLNERAFQWQREWDVLQPTPEFCCKQVEDEVRLVIHQAERRHGMPAGEIKFHFTMAVETTDGDFDLLVTNDGACRLD